MDGHALLFIFPFPAFSDLPRRGFQIHVQLSAGLPFDLGNQYLATASGKYWDSETFKSLLRNPHRWGANIDLKSNY